MTVSTLNRRSFFQKLSKAMPKELGVQAGSEKKEQLFQISDQELPLVPPPATTVTLAGGLEPYLGPWDLEQASHLLRRAGFGVKKSDRDLLLSMTVDMAVNHLLNISQPAPDDVPLNNYYFPGNGTDPEDGYNDPNVAQGQTWVNAAYDNAAEGYRTESFRGWWFDQMLKDDASVREKMTLFWHNHFATQTVSVFYGRVCYEHNQLLRQHCLGNFKTLTKEVTKNVMMLIYLNGYLNSKEAPDENYARELQELFTIGKDNPDHYTEEDVVAAAKVLTGWTIDSYLTDIHTVYYAPNHDTSNKQFSAFYNNTVIQGVGGPNGGEQELDALLDMIFAKNEVAEYLCRKFYRWFVYYHIDANAEANVIQPLAQLFRDNNYEIKPVIEALLKSTHFFDALNKGCFIRTPVDYVIGTMRSYNMSIPSGTLWDDLTMKFYLRYFLESMQMVPGDPPNVAGWQAFRQSPLYYRMWINSNTVRNRSFYVLAMYSGNITTVNGLVFQLDPLAFAAQFSDPSDINALIDDSIKLLLPQPISDQKKAYLKLIMLSGLPSDSYWTVAWNDYLNDPTNPMTLAVVRTRLVNMLVYMMLLPEHNLA
ncbi:MAG: DUF1800 domain-containing protein [Saprospiraceae bacterium]|nr:DUF1800 domain-containing protein [Saprospiraceae bacterium]